MANTFKHKNIAKNKRGINAFNPFHWRLWHNSRKWATTMVNRAFRHKMKRKLKTGQFDDTHEKQKKEVDWIID